MKTRQCTKCEAKIPANSPDKLCPKCLFLEANHSTLSFDESNLDYFQSTISLPETRLSENLLDPNEIFGDYKIIKLLGKGGMGEVYEAVHLRSSRRLALKVLSHQIESNEARNHFIREGQIAANINHLNSVYVFGTEEIDHHPIITMELVSSGNLKDIIQKNGPLPIEDAVGYILQCIEGLKAAHQKGILHRDIKPSNLFVDDRNLIKVGDYGLSISTLEYESHIINGDTHFMGTPAFASPEQIKGNPLDFTSDIYSLGATLYYLITGKTLFKENDLTRLMIKTIEEEPQLELSNREASAFEKIIRKSIHKNSQLRYQNLDDFKKDLQPYTKQNGTPASIIKKAAAFYIDHLFITTPFLFFILLGFELNTLTSFFTIYLLQALYFAITEGLYGKSFAKILLSLKVVDKTTNQTCGSLKSFFRFFIISLFISPPYLTLDLFVNPTNIYGGQYSFSAEDFVYLTLACIYIYFMVKNSDNRGLHDLLTSTKVIQVSENEQRISLDIKSQKSPEAKDSLKLGPYHILGDLYQSIKPDNEFLLGYDMQLARKVWIQKLDHHSKELSRARKETTRFSRLKWLMGIESQWQAFEALEGQSLSNLIQSGLTWESFKFILHDLIQEIYEAERTNSLPRESGLDYIWVTQDGNAKLLDFSAPDLKQRQEHLDFKWEKGDKLGQAKTFFIQISQASLDGYIDQPRLPKTAIPVHAREFLHGLKNNNSLLEILDKSQEILLNKSKISSRQHLLYSIVLILPFVLSFSAYLFFEVVQQSLNNLELTEIKQFSEDMNKMSNQINSEGEVSNDIFKKFYHVVSSNLSFKNVFSIELIEDSLPLVFMMIGLPSIFLNVIFNFNLFHFLFGLKLVNHNGTSVSRIVRSLREILVWLPLIPSFLLLFFYQYFSISIIIQNIALTLLFTMSLNALFNKDRNIYDLFTNTIKVPR